MKTLVALLICCSLSALAFGAISSDSDSDLVSTKAVFGTGIKVADVTKRVTELVKTEPNGFTAKADWLGIDPIPYSNKALVIFYDYKGKHCLLLIATQQKITRQLLVENARRPDPAEKRADPL